MPNQVNLRYPGGRDRALTFSYDDGVQQDATLVDIFAEHGLKGTFNLNSGLFASEGETFAPGTVLRRMTLTDILKTFKGTPHEIGIHGLTHPNLERLTGNRLMYEIMEDRARLEAHFNTIVRGGAYPYGTWNDETVAALSASSIAYCRTTQSTLRFDHPQNWLLLSPTCHHNEPRLMELAKSFIQDQDLRAPYLFYVWGHSYEFERDQNWDVIRRFAELTGHNANVYYATNIELYDYCQAFRSLRFNSIGTIMENPTAIPLWYECRGVVACIRPGERVTLSV